MEHWSAQNPGSIREMFGRIASRYDLTNSVLSLGIHHLWKKKLVREANVQPQDRILDCATGTGDLAFLFEKAQKGQGEIRGTDFCEPMLDEARKKALQKHSRVQFEWADVTALPYPDHSFDVASISFGIRNVSNPLQGLAELARVVKPGGRVLVLEFGQPERGLLSVLFPFYSQKILPRLGGTLSGEKTAYEYLQTSSSQFPAGGAFLQLAQKTGCYAETQAIAFQGGIAYLYLLTVRAGQSQSSSPRN